jgi:hypothetical protein
MSIDAAISYALANIDPKLLTGPVTSTAKQKLGQ